MNDDLREELLNLLTDLWIALGQDYDATRPHCTDDPKVQATMKALAAKIRGTDTKEGTMNDETFFVLKKLFNGPVRPDVRYSLHWAGRDTEVVAKAREGFATGRGADGQEAYDALRRTERELEEKSCRR